MKKVLLLLTVFACFSFTLIEGNKEATNEIEEIAYLCPPNSSPISSSCISGCLSVMPRVTGSLEIDVMNLNEGPRKPTAAEFNQAQKILDDFCDSL